ncbi:hypothetical protein CLIB1423_28S01112 [[Candida] railenensis]|uniref:AMP-activated protein kinase glycogen-binding domain-containing protein n=1 Tax=[Candida] railenensis TaxID=45579 RepID=A0A9P0QTV8_9ASCO|nr:hypothetical protein CLIB1423_28S01112 [[Candida] railenensis]
MSTFTFSWPAGPQEVILTGTFDNWSKTLFLVKQADGSFELTVPLPSSDEPLLYKYVVDGEWVVSQSQKISKDESGNENNVIDKDDLVSASTKGSVIPESGLPIAAVAGATAVGGSDLKTTVLPKEEPSHPTIAGEPGIVIPKDPEALEAFKTVSDVDPKTLNGETEPELSAEEKKKQKKKVKKSKYKAKKKSAKTGTEGTSTEEQTPEPEAPVAAAEIAAVPAAVAATETPAAPASDDATVAAKTAVENAKVEEPVPEPVVEEPVAVAAEPASDAGVHTLDPKAHQADTSAENIPEPTIEEHPAPSIEKTSAPVLPESVLPLTEEKEVDASPVTKTEEVEETPVAAPVAEPAVAEGKKEIVDDEEIVVTQGGDINNLKEALAATEGDVTIEEIKPTESEAERLTKEANIPKETAAKPEKVAAPAPAKKEVAKKTEKKEKKGFLSKLKKIFK